MSEPPAASADYSLRILWSLARWLEDIKGREALVRFASVAKLAPADFESGTTWISHEQFEALMTEALAETGSEQQLKEACAHRFRENYGPVRYMLWAFTPKTLYDTAIKVSKMVTTVGRFETLESSRTAYTLRYYSKKPESRLMCLSRQIQWELGPTLWDLPRAQLEEHACIANGDEYCEYSLRWFARWRALYLLAGFLIGLTAAAVVVLLHAEVYSSAALPFLGLAVAHMIELRRMHRLNLQLGQDVNAVLRRLGAEEAEARAEIVELQERQREWIRIMEQQVAERTTVLEKIVHGLDIVQESRVTTLHGFSHDLRNPLFVLKGNTSFLKDFVTTPEGTEALHDMEQASEQIETMLLALMDVATQETSTMKLTPTCIASAPLADVLRRRLRALVFGRDIKVTVFCTREAPDAIDIDRLVFDRVIDNLLTNAAKYTVRGSIILEITGTPLPSFVDGATADEYLTLKLSDTGLGIEADQVERVFRPRPANEVSTRESHGIGLSSAVRLLAQIGGRLDVMSKPGVGTTFWAHLPKAAVENKRIMAPHETFESVITRVVTIRKAAS